MLTRYGASRAELQELLRDEPRFRAEQVWDALWRRRIPLADATELPRPLREHLDVALPLALDDRQRGHRAGRADRQVAVGHR